MEKRQMHKQLDAVIFINLDSRKDREIRMRQEFQKWKIPDSKIVRIPGIPGGFRGCTLAHIRALEYANLRKFQKVLICEDDLELLSENWGEDFGGADMYMLAMTPIRLKKLSATRVLVLQALGMAGYVISRTYIPRLISIFCEALVYRIPHDLVTQKYQQSEKWQGFYPPVFHQRPGHSDLENKETDYSEFELRGKLLSHIS